MISESEKVGLSSSIAMGTHTGMSAPLGMRGSSSGSSGVGIGIGGGGARSSNALMNWQFPDEVGGSAADTDDDDFHRAKRPVQLLYPAASQSASQSVSQSDGLSKSYSSSSNNSNNNIIGQTPPTTTLRRSASSGSGAGNKSVLAQY